MNEIIKTTKKELENMDTTVQGKHLKTGDIRRLSAKLFKTINDKSKEYVFTVCDELLEQRDAAMGVIAFDFVYRMKEQYDKNTFAVFETWLEKYVRGWGDCDDFCTHAFVELICQNIPLTSKIVKRTK
jgi:hypothetical protein